MTSHKLAKLLLENSDLPIALFVNNHTYHFKTDRISHGKISVGINENYSGKHLIIGNFDEEYFNGRNPNDGTIIIKSY